MARMTAAPPGATDAYRSMASASAQIGTRAVEYQEECRIDGAPAIDVVRHETYAQLANVVFSVICLAPSSKSPEYAAAFDHASVPTFSIAIGRSSRTGDAERELVQLQALGLLDRYHLYLINAAAPLPLAEHYAPVFNDILRSLRVLPTR